MPREDEYSDEYLTNAVKQDAHASALKYSALGLQAFLPKRPTGAAPKPNTRFLRNILRETDSHNAALLAKEKREARERERALARSAPGRLSPMDEDKLHAPREEHSHARRKRRRETRSRSRSRSPRREKKRDNDDGRRVQEGKRRSRHRSYSAERLRDSDESPERARRREKRSHKRSKSKDERRRENKRERDPRRSSRDRSESRSRTKHAKRSDETRPRRRSSQSSESTAPPISRDIPKLQSAKVAQKRARLTPTHSDTRSDSDPLDAIIGPAPPPPEPELKSKGRGAFSSSSAAMDAHFSSSYDPAIDVQPDPASEDDWEMALEAIRDRQKWRQQGADRLRSAGFSEAEVKKWEKGDTKDETDVIWAKKGEGREWDRGKVVGDETVELKPSWA